MTEEDRFKADRLAETLALKGVVRLILGVLEARHPGLRRSMRGSLSELEDQIFSHGEAPDWVDHVRHRLIVELDDLLSN